MFTSLSEFKFYQSFRIPVEGADDVRFLVDKELDLEKYQAIEDAKLVDISVTGVGFKTKERLSVGSRLRLSFQFKKLRFDLDASVVRAFGSGLDDEEIMYGVEVNEEDINQSKKFLEKYIMSFSPDRSKDCLSQLTLKERYTSPTEGFEMFSLLLSLFKDITQFGNQENFVESMLEEIARILNAQRASIFLINPTTNELEAVAALGIDKDLLKIDYRRGIAGSVFTTGVALNIDTRSDKVRYTDDFDKKTGFQTRSIICHPISNREDKIIGVLEVLNKRNQDRFTVEDEKTMKVLALIFSSVFHNYNPISERSLIRRFSTPYDREHALLGRSPVVNELRRSIVKLKDVDSALLIEGEPGVGKKLVATIIHQEGKRGLNSYQSVDCSAHSEGELEKIIFGRNEKGLLESSINGTVTFEKIECLSLDLQDKLFKALTTRKLNDSEITLDVRAIFTTEAVLEKEVAKKAFHEELFHLISTTLLKIKPLRSRKEDIEDLLPYFLKKECKKQGLLLKEFSSKVKEEFMEHEWPGNISELKQAVQRAVLYNPKAHVISNLKGDVLPVVDYGRSNNILEGNSTVNDSNIPLKERMAIVEREIILKEVKRHKGNKSQAAKAMGISREALRKKLINSDEILTDLEDSHEEVKKAG